MNIRHKHSVSDPPLYGDYGSIIDTVFKNLTKAQITNIKQSVALADQNNRGGLAKLKDFMARHGKTLADRSAIEEILQSCEADQAAYEQLQTEQFTTGIDQLPSGSYRVRVTVEHNKFVKTFRSKPEAVAYRDRMKALDTDLKAGFDTL